MRKYTNKYVVEKTDVLQGLEKILKKWGYNKAI